eukprot:464918-Pleurochrysis_carterae.AAC.1
MHKAAENACAESGREEEEKYFLPLSQSKERAERRALTNKSLTRRPRRKQRNKEGDDADKTWPVG